MSSDPRPRIHCTACNAMIRIPYEAIGRWITCPRCGHEFAAILEGLREPRVVDEEEYVPSRQRLKWNWGWALILAGLAVILFYWLVYDPTVPEYPGFPEHGRIINLPRMHNRNMGLLAGCGIAGVGGLVVALKRRGEPAS